MAKTYLQAAWSQVGNVLSVLDVSGSRMVLSIQSPLAGSSPRTTVDETLGNVIADNGLGVDGTGPYYDPAGSPFGQDAALVFDVGQPIAVVATPE